LPRYRFEAERERRADGPGYRVGREALVVTPSIIEPFGDEAAGMNDTDDPPPVEEVVAVMRVAGESAYGLRTRALIVVLWRAGLRISEALALAESDLDRDRGAILVRRGKGGKRREVGMDRWAWEQIDPWLRLRISLRVGALLCVVHGPTQGRPWSAAGVRETLRQLAVRAGVRRRFAPHQFGTRTLLRWLEKACRST
jgi:site-specific recombinase XerC